MNPMEMHLHAPAAGSEDRIARAVQRRKDSSNQT